MQHAANIEFQQIQQYQRNNQNILANVQHTLLSPAQAVQNAANAAAAAAQNAAAAANPQQLQQLMQHRQQQQQIQQQRSMRPPFPFNRAQSQTGQHAQGLF